MKAKIFKYLILRLCVFAVFIILLNSCTTQRACNRKFPPQIRTDSIVVNKIKNIYKDTTIYIYIKADTVELTDTVYITKTGPQSKILESDLKYSYARAWVKNGKINLYHQTKDTIIQNLIKNAIRETEKNETTTVIKEKIKKVPFFPWWSKILMGLSLPTIIYLLFKVIKLLI